LGEFDYRGSKPLCEHIVHTAREMGLAGATVLRGKMGFGSSATSNAQKSFSASQSVPAVIEIIDDEPKIASLLLVLAEVLTGQFVTTQMVSVIEFD